MVFSELVSQVNGFSIKTLKSNISNFVKEQDFRPISERDFSQSLLARLAIAYINPQSVKKNSKTLIVAALNMGK